MVYVLGIGLCVLSGQWWAIPIAVALASWLSSTEAEIAQEIVDNTPSSPWGVLGRMALVAVVCGAAYFGLLAVWVGGAL